MVGSGPGGNNPMTAVKITANNRADIRRVAEMSRDFHEEAMERGPFNMDRVVSFLSQVCSSAKAMMFVAKSDSGEVIGFLVCQCGENYLTGERIAEETAIYVSKHWRSSGAGDALFGAFEGWAANDMRASRNRVTAQASLRFAGVVKWFKSKGYAETELSLTKEVIT